MILYSYTNFIHLIGMSINMKKHAINQYEEARNHNLDLRESNKFFFFCLYTHLQPFTNIIYNSP